MPIIQSIKNTCKNIKNRKNVNDTKYREHTKISKMHKECPQYKASETRKNMKNSQQYKYHEHIKISSMKRNRAGYEKYSNNIIKNMQCIGESKKAAFDLRTAD